MLSETDELHCDALSGLGWDGNFGGFPNNTHVSISWGNITYALYCTIYSVSCTRQDVVIDFKASCEPL